MAQRETHKPGDQSVLTSDPITTRQLVMYAGASGDFNPIHYDQDYAKSAGLGGVIAHGMLTMAIAGRCVSDWAGPDRHVAGLRGRFLHPVKPGDQVQITLTVEDVSDAVSLDVVGMVNDKRVFAGSARVTDR
ncbi:MaoC/PaaZ C-terminal domain-containing protein [Rhodobacteraceae bacterium KMM 6894]|nr:MaoC/PaaZ C-terminal domain-containing protein [Rhodobacteraceae bacterium KMM 6894]